MQDKKENSSLKKARGVFHPMTNFIPKGFNERTFPKEVKKSFRAFFAETALITRFDCNFRKEIVRCQFSRQKFKLKYTQFRFVGTIEKEEYTIHPNQ